MPQQHPSPSSRTGVFPRTHTPAGARAITAGTPSQLNYAPFASSSYGEFVDNWTTTGPKLSQNVIWFPGAHAASHTKASDVLKFLSSGTPSGLPPYALLSNVSIVGNVVPVPEPPVLVLFGGGLLGLGLMTMLARRRARHPPGEDNAV